MGFKTFLQQSAQEVDQRIDEFFDSWTKEVNTVSPHLSPLLQALWDICKDGKRIRAALIKLGYVLSPSVNPLEKRPEIYEKAPNTPESFAVNGTLSDVLAVSAAYELFHAAILAHDDIIDKSPTRRGKLTLYQQFGGEHYGISQAICLADIGFFLAFNLISESQFDDVVKNKAITFFSKTMLDTTIGELLDVELSNKKDLAGEEEILTIYRFKTAYYTIVAPLSLGAMLKGADDSLLSAIREYGEHVGITYQIQDDINDIFGDTKELKKDLAADVREGKNTLLYCIAKQKANSSQQQALTLYYGKPDVTMQGVEVIMSVFRDSGALAYTQELANKHVEAAKNLVSNITQDEEQKAMLTEIAEYFIKKG